MGWLSNNEMKKTNYVVCFKTPLILINSIIFKLSERKYKDNSRFCDLLSSSSNDSSKDDDRRVEDEASNTSNNFNEMMIMVADEDMRGRNNYTSSFLDYDLLLGGGQRRKHDSVIDKQ